MVTPLFPALTVSYIESHWFAGDEPVDEDAVLTAMEKEAVNQYAEINQKFAEYLPSSNSSNEAYEDDEEEEEEDNDDDDEGSGSNDDDNEEELEVDDMPFNPDSPIINMA
ncbi:uncharacterized protein LOC141856422 [Brevipalpus obovatus]|uniref:uncharacterized protein LOC141856422 n=1 Tax=Brevipalpus obovatus TaxID=246614 RepID=UPI003D9EF3B8